MLHCVFEALWTFFGFTGALTTLFPRETYECDKTRWVFPTDPREKFLKLVVWSISGKLHKETQQQCCNNIEFGLVVHDKPLPQANLSSWPGSSCQSLDSTYLRAEHEFRLSTRLKHLILNGKRRRCISHPHTLDLHRMFVLLRCAVQKPGYLSVFAWWLVQQLKPLGFRFL